MGKEVARAHGRAGLLPKERSTLVPGRYSGLSSIIHTLSLSVDLGMMADRVHAITYPAVVLKGWSHIRIKIAIFRQLLDQNNLF
jgi:hypothetical protein